MFLAAAYFTALSPASADDESPDPVPEAATPADSTAATADSTATPADSAAATPDSTTATPPDSSATPADSTHSDSWFSSTISKYLYVEPKYDADAEAESITADSPFQAYAGKTIRRITIEQTGFFSARDDESASWVQRNGSKFHVDTRERVIRKFFLFAEGDELDPFSLADTERILRRTRFLGDALIEVVPVEGGSKYVDVRVSTRDTWSIGLTFVPREVNSFKTRIYDRNLAGLGQDLQFTFDANGDRDPKLEFEASHTEPNLLGQFLESRLWYEQKKTRESLGLGIDRATDIQSLRIRGGASFFRQREFVIDQPDRDNTRDVQDIWIGRAFDVGERSGQIPSKQIMLAIRTARTDYTKRPLVTRNSNREFRDQTLSLASLSYYRNWFQKSRLVYRTDRSEDIPNGFVTTVTAGGEKSELEDRAYSSLETSAGRYWGELGYLAAEFRVGGYFRGWELEDGVGSTGFFYFTPLQGGSEFRHRQFLLGSYTRGVRRREAGRLELGHDTGVRGLKNTELFGSHRLNFNLSSTLFTPWRLWGFDATFFGFFNGGLIADTFSGLRSSRLYSGIGGGVRVFNKFLAFGAVELRLTYFPNVPPGAKPEYVRFSGIQNVTVPSFNPGAPSVLPYD